MVRTYILTKTKRKIIEAYLKDGTKITGFRDLKRLILNLDLDHVESDLDLIKEFLARFAHNDP